ncbi:2OG-Fe dioxygenase family protein [Rhodoferax sp.]|uniref:2OG-Fe dioxygenase family protein n=1 Tax=Rhodoferax sp. TaxID=50421 RepID=UPI00262046CA|nr:2OG-Fe dioxygenase family protein [Rhodoferax sp.]MDD2926912.1 2OG-Fe dioxygenase family protein [Rhodoferax sp.]
MSHFFSPAPAVEPAVCAQTLQRQGYAVLGAQGVCALSDCPVQALDALRDTWADLPPDNYLKDGGHYRRRRHACFVVSDGAVRQVPHRAHWQPLEYNALHGGMQRLFEPILPTVVGRPVWNQLLLWLGKVCSGLKGEQPWFVEVHQFRIDTTDGIGRPTPEGAHRDGMDMVAVFMVNRQNIKGGETRVFEADGPNGQRFTLTEPWSVLLLDDTRVIHETTPIQPLTTPGLSPQDCFRDTLVVTLRAHNFQGDEA